MYYELHITMRYDTKVDPEVWTQFIRWKYSKIDGDPNLGKGILHYATKHVHASVPVEKVIHILKEAAQCLRDMGCTVVRMKVEYILFDKKEITQ